MAVLKQIPVRRSSVDSRERYGRTDPHEVDAWRRDITNAIANVTGSGATVVDHDTLGKLIWSTAGHTIDTVFNLGGNDISNPGIGHDLFTDFVSDEHIPHSGVTLTAGAGLTGGGDITSNRSFAVDLTSFDTGFDTGSVVFIGAAGVLAEDNDQFYFNNTTKFLRLGNSGVEPNVKIHMGSAAGELPRIQFTNMTTGHTATDGTIIGSGSIMGGLNDWEIVNQEALGDIIFGTNSIEALRINPNQTATAVGEWSFPSIVVDTNTLVANVSGYTDKVGIGTATPAYTLDLLGNCRLKNSTGINSFILWPRSEASTTEQSFFLNFVPTADNALVQIHIRNNADIPSASGISGCIARLRLENGSGGFASMDMLQKTNASVDEFKMSMNTRTYFGGWDDGGGGTNFYMNDRTSPINMAYFFYNEDGNTIFHWVTGNNILSLVEGDTGTTDTLVIGGTSVDSGVGFQIDKLVTRISSDNKLQFRDADIYIHSSGAGELDIVSDGTLDINATHTNFGDGQFPTLDAASGNGIKVDSGGTPTFGWKDIIGTPQEPVTGSGKPSFSQIASSGIYAWNYAIGDEQYYVFHMPHDYVVGTDIHFHVHWFGSQTAGGYTNWDIDYIYSQGHDQSPFPTTASNTSVQQQQDTTAYQHMIAETSAITIANLEPDGLVIVKIDRIATVGQTDVSGGVFVPVVDIHYQSTNIPTKYKDLAVGSSFYA